MNIKKIFAGIIAVCVVGGVMPSVDIVVDNAVITANAEDYTEGTYEQLKYINYGDHIEITACDQSATEVVIPPEIEGLPFTIIGNSAFYDCKNLKSVTIPDSVTRISAQTFKRCRSLESITIPNGVTYIGEGTFSNCDKLTSVKLPESLEIIGRNYKK